MSKRARSLRVVGIAVTILSITSASVAQGMSTGSTFNLDHAIHKDVLDLPEYIADPAGPGLANAVSLFTVDQRRCNYTDNTVCLNLTTSYQGTFGFSGDGYLDCDSSEAYSVAVSTPWIPIKIVGTIFHNGTFKGGVTAQGYFASTIAFDFGYTVYGHEFGHMCGLAPRDDCTDALMWEDTSGAHDNLNFGEAMQIDQTYDLCCVTAGTADCDATGIAWLEDTSAISGSGGVSISFRTVWEANTQSFEVKRVDPESRTALYTMGTATPTSDGNGKKYAIADPNGASGAVYQIVEHQQSGYGDLLTGPVIAGPAPVPISPPEYNADSLADVVSSYDDGLRIDPRPNLCNNQFPPLMSRPQYEILCPDSLASALFSYASLWRDRGVDTQVINKAIMDSCAGGYAGWIRWASARGTGCFLLVGDANDHVWWDDSTRWINGWRYPGIYRYHLDTGWDEFIFHKPSQPLKDIIPTFYCGVTDPPHEAWTAWTPYFATDLPYADVDGDSLPDVIVGRLPASTVADVVAYTQKLNTWLSSTNGSLGPNAALLTYAVNSGATPAWPTAFAMDSLGSAFPPATQVTKAAYTYFGPSFWGFQFQDSISAIATAAGSGGADVIVWNLNSSDRYENTGFWRIRQNSDPLPVGVTNRPFISVGLSCAMNNFDQTETYDYINLQPPYQFLNPRRPLVERLLFEDPSKGAIAQIGPTRGSFIEGNPLFGEEFLRRLYTPGNSIGSAFLLAQRLCMQRYPNYRDLFKSYVLLGDPRLGPNTVTGVESAPKPSIESRLLQPQPNPFNPTTQLRYYLDHAARISITIYDVQGRIVRRLVPDGLRPMGWGSLRWTGDTESGSSAASGVYFARLRAAGISSVQRLVLLR